MCVCRLLLWRGCNPRLRQTLQVVEPRLVREPQTRLGWSWSGWSWRLEEQDTQEGVTVDQQLVKLAREGGRGGDEGPGPERQSPHCETTRYRYSDPPAGPEGAAK